MTDKFGIKEIAKYFGHNVIIKVEEELKKQRAKFLADLKLIKVWAKEHVKDAYDPIGSLIDDIDDTLVKKWEGK